MADDETPEQPASEEPAKKPYHDYHQQQADKHQQQALVDAQVAEDLMSNPRYDAFFAPYQPQVREQFVRDYVSKRHLWTQYGDFYERHLAGNLTQFEEEAYIRLWDIQQKKLFDLQCEWRAELVSVPGVNTSADFDTLGGLIEHCTVIPPITPAELAMYLDWVQQADYEEELHDRDHIWQRYDDVKAQLHAEAEEEARDSAYFFGSVSEWYAFHNQRTGHDRLLHLPDLRGQKEKHYLDAWRAHNKAKREAEPTPAPSAPPDPRPAYIPYDETQRLLGVFAQQFESAALNRQRTSYETANPPSTWEDEELERVLDFLKDIDEPVPIAAGDDWRQALREASYAFRKQKLLASLPQAYEAYCQRQEWGIAQPASEDEPHSTAPWYNKAILKGRKLLGEPKDFNF
ncbi:hypothetical protein [Hymenobacter ruricola]|uniref:Uncharacterized protein n=1 Tax=Hymenobacter ruricola TaxID=2791023 RepID=A0ABS0I827_9BACT|nr:hypothetical protein [Hymenobacter ruricola]MBF9223119.1 hypothetical protein [Hymenobacter ruricola]